MTAPTVERTLRRERGYCGVVWSFRFFAGSSRSFRFPRFRQGFALGDLIWSHLPLLPFVTSLAFFSGTTCLVSHCLSWQPLRVPLERELAVDNFLKLRLWLGATQKHAVDEKGGRARNSDLDSLLAVRLYVLLELAASEAGTKGDFIQP